MATFLFGNDTTVPRLCIGFMVRLWQFAADFPLCAVQRIFHGTVIAVAHVTIIALETALPGAGAGTAQSRKNRAAARIGLRRSSHPLNGGQTERQHGKFENEFFHIPEPPSNGRILTREEEGVHGRTEVSGF